MDVKLKFQHSFHYMEMISSLTQNISKDGKMTAEVKITKLSKSKGDYFSIK